MNKMQKLGMSMIATFTITTGGAITAAATEAGGVMSWAAVGVAVIVGVVAAAKDMQTYLAEPPK